MNVLYKTGVIFVLALANYLGLLFVLGLTQALPIRQWALDLGASHHEAAVAYLVGNHTVALLLVSLPIALILPLIFRRHLLSAALLVSLWPALELFIGIFSIPADQLITIAWATTDVVKLLLFLPLLSWIFSKLLPYPRAV